MVKKLCAAATTRTPIVFDGEARCVWVLLAEDAQLEASLRLDLGELRVHLCSLARCEELLEVNHSLNRPCWEQLGLVDTLRPRQGRQRRSRR